MTTRTLIFCETCTRSEDAEGAHQRGWGTLSTVKQGTRDICPQCLAKLNGWTFVDEPNGHTRRAVANAGLIPLERRIVDVETTRA